MGDFFERLEHLRIVTFYATNNRLYGTFTAMHYFTLFILTGTAVIMDLRLLGLVGARASVAELADEIFPWTWTALGFALFSGFALWLTTAGDYYRSPAMNGKLVIVALAIVGTILIRMGISRWDAQPDKWKWIAVGFALFSILVLWVSPASHYWLGVPAIARTIVLSVAAAVAILVWLAIRVWGKPEGTPVAAKILATLSIVLFILAILGGNNIAALCGLG